MSFFCTILDTAALRCRCDETVAALVTSPHSLLQRCGVAVTTHLCTRDVTTLDTAMSWCCTCDVSPIAIMTSIPIGNSAMSLLFSRKIKQWTDDKISGPALNGVISLKTYAMHSFDRIVLTKLCPIVTWMLSVMVVVRMKPFEAKELSHGGH